MKKYSWLKVVTSLAITAGVLIPSTGGAYAATEEKEQVIVGFKSSVNEKVLQKQTVK